MTKEQFCAKWEFSSYWKADLEAVIATEIAKVQEVKPEELKGNCSTFDMSRLVDQEYKPTKQPSSQGKLDNSFDRNRFERIFCAIVASGKTETWEQDFKGTIKTIEKLDAFYASKEGGNNG